MEDDCPLGYSHAGIAEKAGSCFKVIDNKSVRGGDQCDEHDDLRMPAKLPPAETMQRIGKM